MTGENSGGARRGSSRQRGGGAGEQLSSGGAWLACPVGNSEWTGLETGATSVRGLALDWALMGYWMAAPQAV